MRALQNKSALFERGGARILALAAEYKLPLITGFVFGLAANLYAFTNKFVNADELEYLFSKGATLSSGRWALALTSCIFPDVSMPWIYGVIAVMILTLSACVIICTFEIKGRILQCVLAGLIVSFPVQAMTFAYMFTCVPYAIAVLLVSIAVYNYSRGGKCGWIVSSVLLTLALGIYQAYISLAVSLFLVYIVKRTLDGEMSWQRLIRHGLGCIGVLLTAAVLYFAVNKAVMLVTNTEYNSYASSAVRPNIDFGLQAANAMFKSAVNAQFLSFVPTEFSSFVHKLLILLAVTELAVQCVLCNDWEKRIIIAVLVLIFPIAINCLLVVAPIPHPLEYFSFFSVYVLAAVATDKFRLPAAVYVNDIAAVLLALILLDSVVFSNTIFLKQRLLYEQAAGFYSGVVSRIIMQDDYDENDIIVLVGSSADGYSGIPEIDTEELPGIRNDMINVYSKDDLIRCYLGVDAEIRQLTGNEDDELARASASMPIYPYDGSVKCIGDFVVVKLG